MYSHLQDPFYFNHLPWGTIESDAVQLTIDTIRYICIKLGRLREKTSKIHNNSQLWNFMNQPLHGMINFPCQINFITKKDFANIFVLVLGFINAVHDLIN